jgi:chemotaxis protein methyltransferase CheR
MMSSTAALFADAAFFRALRGSVTPHLRTWPYVNVWLLDGVADAYPFAIALREEGLDGRVRVHATSDDDAVLRGAREGAFPAAALAHAHAAYKEGGGRASLVDYFDVTGDMAVVREDLRRHVVLAQHSPATDASFAEMQLVVACAALRTRDRGVRARALHIAHESLCRFGILAVDDLDGHPHKGSYEPLDVPGFFRRGDA